MLLITGRTLNQFIVILNAQTANIMNNNEIRKRKIRL